jgi:hypothetical protein
VFDIEQSEMALPAGLAMDPATLGQQYAFDSQRHLPASDFPVDTFDGGLAGFA